MPPVETFGGAIAKGRPRDQPVDFSPRFDLAELEGSLETACGRVQQFGQLQLPGVKIEPAQPVGHHVERQDADGELVLHAQPLGDRPIEIARTDAQLVGQRLGTRIEIGEVIAPALDLATNRSDRARTLRLPAAALAPSIEQAGEGLGRGRGIVDPGLQLGAVDRDIREQRIGQAPPHRRRAAARLLLAERANVEVEQFGEPQNQPCRQRTPIAFDQREIAVRDAEHFSHYLLGQAVVTPHSPDPWSCQYTLFGHGAPRDVRSLQDYTRATAFGHSRTSKYEPAR